MNVYLLYHSRGPMFSIDRTEIDSVYTSRERAERACVESNNAVKDKKDDEFHIEVRRIEEFGLYCEESMEGD